MAEKAGLTTEGLELSLLSRRGADAVHVLSRPSGPEYIVKHMPSRPPEHLRTIVDGHRRAVRLLATHPRFGAVKVLGAAPREHLMLMERIQGRTARDLIVNGPSQPIEVIRDCLGWAAAFHASDLLADRQFPTGDIAAAISKAADPVLSGKIEVPSSGDFTAAAAMARRFADRLDGTLCDLGPSHLDLNLDNLLLDGAGRLVAIDIGGTPSLPAAADQARLLIACGVTLPAMADDETFEALRDAACPPTDVEGRARLDMFLMLDILRIWRWMTRPSVTLDRRRTRAIAWIGHLSRRIGA